ncbi:hypothetical protein [Pedobacter duraquae]|uniref:Outer membrane protein with beta-barrel domain n=1 Tax=Pedobacter duraquae TaxID=425511 RepID=A0A4R6IGF5_9SPHI|nr:hypothetical protein [Pedobacter duraquae]TDO20851.1 hypothetical protein CLV32_3485 [Pedobacter duraquae]
MENEHDIDHLFKRGLSDPEIPFNELDWNKMERLMDRKKNRVIPLWWYLIGGVAATLILLLSGVFSDYAPVKHNNNNNQLAKKPETSENRKLPGENGSGNMVTNRPVPVITLNVREANLPAASQRHILGDSTILSAIINPDDRMLSSFPELLAVDIKGRMATDSVTFDARSYAITLNNTDVLERNSEDSVSVQKVTPKHTKNRGLIMSILAAPDVSSAKMNVSSKLSSNIGFSITYPLTNRLSLTSGVVYAKKYYNSVGLGTLATGYLNKAWQINADCSVLDIPLNVNYKVLQKKTFSITVNTGLSSYFMLNEKYDFLVGTGSSQHVSQIEIKNQNQHLLGVANFSVSFDRRITRNLSLGVQPFVKVPLTGIGQYDSKLRSTGMSFSLNIGLFHPKKKD